MSERGPRPRAGSIFVERIDGEYETEHGVVLAGDDEHGLLERVRVVKIGPPEIEDGVSFAVDFSEGDEVLVTSHAGRTFSWFDSEGRERTLWIVAEGEVRVVFDDEEETDYDEGNGNEEERGQL